MHDLTRRVKRTGGFAGNSAGFGIHRGEQIFKGASQKLGVERNVLFKRSIFFHGKLVIPENAENSTCLRRSRFTEKSCNFWDGTFFSEEKKVGNEGLLGCDIGKTIYPDFRSEVIVITGKLIKVFKQSAIEKRDGFVEFLHGGFLTKEGNMAEVALVSIVRVVPLEATVCAKLPFFDWRSKCGEEEVLQDSLVVASKLIVITGSLLPIAQQSFDFVFGKECIRQHAFFAEEPAEN